MSIKIITDSSAYFANPKFCKAHDVTVVPIGIRVGGELVAEDTLTTEGLFERLAPGEVPDLVAPSARQFADMLEPLSRQADTILAIHCSGQLLPVPQNARAGADYVLGRAHVHVIDTGSISLGLGAVVETAVRAVEAGGALEDIIRLTRGCMQRLYSVFFSERLDFLGKSGQLGQAHALVGEMLGIKPILNLEEGAFSPMEKATTREAAIEKLVEFSIEIAEIERSGIIQAGPRPTPETRRLIELLNAEGGVKREWPLIPMPPSLAVMLGPGAMGVMIVESGK